MIEIVVNEITGDGMHRVRVVSDMPSPLTPLPVGEGSSVRTWDDALLGLHYAEALYPCREVVCVTFEGMKRPRKLVVWKILPGERVSEIVSQVADWYFWSAHRRPQYAFMARLPRGVESGVEVDGVSLFEAEWAIPGCVMIGG